MQSIRKRIAMAAAVAATNFLLAPAFAGGAAASCNSWGLTGGGPLGGPNIITANCRAANGTWHATSAWLPAYLANRNGTLVASSNGYYDRSCTGQWTMGPGPTYYAQCRNSSGGVSTAHININDLLSNQNGNLGW
jgi:hypothetical protein